MSIQKLYSSKYNQNFVDPPVKKDPLERVIVWGEENKVQIQFNANPKPSHAYWTINGTRISIGTTSGNRKYISSPLLGTEVRKPYRIPTFHKKYFNHVSNSKNCVILYAFSSFAF